MKALGLIFRNVFEFWIFVYFCMFYSTLKFTDFHDFLEISKSYINLLRIYIGFEPKSEKSENRFYVWRCNFWSRADITIKVVTFSSPGTLEKVSRKKFQKFSFLRPVWKLQRRSYMVFSTFPENPDLADVQIAIKHAKIDEISKFKNISKI